MSAECVTQVLPLPSTHTHTHFHTGQRWKERGRQWPFIVRSKNQRKSHLRRKQCFCVDILESWWKTDSPLFTRPLCCPFSRSKYTPFSVLSILSCPKVQTQSVSVQIQFKKSEREGEWSRYNTLPDRAFLLPVCVSLTLEPMPELASFYSLEGTFKNIHILLFPQLKAKRNECNSKATHARNEYLLSLAAANAHQRRYYETELIGCIKVTLHFSPGFSPQVC